MEQVVFVAELDNELEPKVVKADVFDGMRSARSEFSVKTMEPSKGSASGLILVSMGVGLVVLAFIFTIQSLWLATHPNFDLTLPKLPSFSAINSGQTGDGVKNPQGTKPTEVVDSVPEAEGYPETAVEDFLSQVAAKENVLADSTPKQSLLDLGVQVCAGVEKGFTEEEIINDFVLKIGAKYPNIVDAESFGQTIYDSAVATLCIEEDPDAIS
jgi:hypothetical protein